MIIPRPPKTALSVFTKTPLLGQCKTRLIPLLGDQGALAAHCELVQYALNQIAEVYDISPSIWVTEKDLQTQRWADRWNIPLERQRGDNLGERMFHCLNQLCGHSSGGAILMGTDCPEINSNYIDLAVHNLASHDMVLGPAEDGGYGLIGMHRAHPPLFENIDWGTDAVAEQTLAAAKALHLNFFELPEIWDVDRPEDWLRYKTFTGRKI
jgi:hypothetical protein